MAAALPVGSTFRLVCIDTFNGSPEHQLGAAYFDADTLASEGCIDTWPTFETNLLAAGLLGSIEPLAMPSLDAAIEFDQPVSLLFLDADHAYQSVCADLLAWLPKLIIGGVIVLHDVGEWEGPTRAAADLIMRGYERCDQRGTALAMRKLCEQDD